MAYVKSKNIQIFPSAFRGQVSGGGTVFNPGSRLTTEYNLSSLASRLSTKHGSFVIKFNDTSSDKEIIFSINGYLFEIKMASHLASFTSNVWARIKLVDITGSDADNTVDTKPVLRPVIEPGILLDEGTVEGNFFGIDLTETKQANASGIYHLLLLTKVGSDWSVPQSSLLRVDSSEISDSSDILKSITEIFTTTEIATDKINKVSITTPATGSTLTIEDAKTLTVKGNVTLEGNGKAVLNKNITVNTNNITLEASGADRTLKISGANKEIAGAGTVLTFGGNFTTSGAFTTQLNATANTEVTLPVSGILVTKDGTETLTNKTLTAPVLIAPSLGVATATSINKVKFTAPSTEAFLTIADGKTLTANQSITLTGDSARTLTINGSSKTLAGAGSTITLGGSLTTSGAHSTVLTTVGNTSVTLPTSGTLATLAGIENLTGKTYNGLTLTSKSLGFEISGGTTSKKITIGSNVLVDGDVVIQDNVRIESPISIDAELRTNSQLTVGTATTNTGAVTIRSHTDGTPTTISGPSNGEAKLIAGTYTTSATTANDIAPSSNTLVKRGSNGEISANYVNADLTGNASTATKAFNDGNGNVITSTYASALEFSNASIPNKIKLVAFSGVSLGELTIKSILNTSWQTATGTTTSLKPGSSYLIRSTVGTYYGGTTDCGVVTMPTNSGSDSVVVVSFPILSPAVSPNLPEGRLIVIRFTYVNSTSVSIHVFSSSINGGETVSAGTSVLFKEIV